MSKAVTVVASTIFITVSTFKQHLKTHLFHTAYFYYFTFTFIFIYYVLCPLYDFVRGH